MNVTFINVGYGDSILVTCDNGYRLLLDGGSALASEYAEDPYRIRCVDYLQTQGIEHLDAVVISHIHEDHVCGLEQICSGVQVEHLYVPYPIEPFLQGREVRWDEPVPRSVPLYGAALNAYRRILLQARDQNTPITVLQPGDKVVFDAGAQMDVLAPMPKRITDYMRGIQAVYAAPDASPALAKALTKLDATSNQTSLLLRFELGSVVFLSAADSCPREWKEVPQNLLQNVNVLKLPHHGQLDSISPEIMREMALRYVITTSASDRRYNSANPKVYEQFLALYPSDRAPQFLFSDEREYPPYFSQPDGFQAINLRIDSDTIHTEFIRLQEKRRKR